MNSKKIFNYLLVKRCIRIILWDRWNKIEFIAWLPNSARILDVWCWNNSPKITKLLKPSAYYVGVDIWDYNQGKWSKEAADEYLISTPETFSQTISSAKGEYDAVISAHNIEHCNAPYETLYAMCSKVKKDGLLFMAFPSERSVSFPSRKGTLNFYDDKTHIYLPEFEKIVNTLKASGFKIVFKSPSYQPLGMKFIGMIVDCIVKKKATCFTRPHYWFEAIIWAKKV